MPKAISKQNSQKHSSGGVTTEVKDISQSDAPSSPATRLHKAWKASKVAGRFLPRQFISHRFVRDRRGAERCSFFGSANAALKERPTFSHRSRSCSRADTFGSASPGRTWPSITMAHFSSRVFSPEVSFCSKDRASLYLRLNLNEPNTCVSDNHQKALNGTRTDI
jgi:hypothetical protein